MKNSLTQKQYNANMMDIKKRCDHLRNLIPKTRSGDPKTDRLEKLDSMLYQQKFSHEDLDFIEREIISAIEFFKKKKELPDKD